FRLTCRNAMEISSLLPGLDPGHLDALELALARRLGIVGEVRQLADPAVKVGEAYSQRIDVGVERSEPLRDVVRIIPGETHGTSSELLERAADDGVAQGDVHDPPCERLGDLAELVVTLPDPEVVVALAGLGERRDRTPDALCLARLEVLRVLLE